jgi:hypothetical protein
MTMAEIVTQTARPTTEESLAKLGAALTVLTHRMDNLEERISVAMAMIRALPVVPTMAPMPGVTRVPVMEPMPGVQFPPPPGNSPFGSTYQPAQLSQWAQEMQHLDNLRKLQAIASILQGGRDE